MEVSGASRFPATLARPAWIAALFLVVFSRVILLPRFVPGHPAGQLVRGGAYLFSIPRYPVWQRRPIHLRSPRAISYRRLYGLRGIGSGRGAFALAGSPGVPVLRAAVQLPPVPRFLWIAAALVSDHNEALYLAAPAAALLLVLSHAANAKRPGPDRRRYGADRLSKFTFFIAADCGIAAIAVLFVAAESAPPRILCVSVFVGEYALLWAVFGGGWSAFWLYLRGSIELAAGYGQVMYIQPDPLQLGCGLACATLCSIIAASVLYGGGRQRSNQLLLWMAILFLAWKHAFVRADASHLLTFFLVRPLFWREFSPAECRRPSGCPNLAAALSGS